VTTEQDVRAAIGRAIGDIIDVVCSYAAEQVALAVVPRKAAGEPRLLDLDYVLAFHVGGQAYDPQDVTIQLKDDAPSFVPAGACSAEHPCQPRERCPGKGVCAESRGEAASPGRPPPVTEQEVRQAMRVHAIGPRSDLHRLAGPLASLLTDITERLGDWLAPAGGSGG
jgi:hypothetical protein